MARDVCYRLHLPEARDTPATKPFDQVRRNPSRKGSFVTRCKTLPLCDRFRGRLARKLECLDVTQSGPDAPAQSVGRVARLSGNVRQPNHVLAN